MGHVSRSSVHSSMPHDFYSRDVVLSVNMAALQWQHKRIAVAGNRDGWIGHRKAKDPVTMLIRVVLSVEQRYNSYFFFFQRVLKCKH